jgi:nitrite reductase/ring-hydroxylating ferredoxin subunit
MALLRAAKKDEIPPGTIREFQLNGTTVAIANVDGKLYAINNVCLHRGGPLGEGELAGKIVTCPWHGWTYD